MALSVPYIKEFLTSFQDTNHDVVADLFDQNFGNEKNLEKILNAVNSLLNDKKTQQLGFSSVSLIVPHCSGNILNEHCVQWIKLSIPIQPNKTVSLEQLCAIEVLLKNCNNIQDFTKALNTGLLPKLIELLLLHLTTNKCLEKAFSCLYLCLKIFPSTCLPLKNKIATTILKFLESDLPDKIIKDAGSIYHLLQQVGGAGPESVNHMINWSSQFQKLCNTAQSLYDIFFENITEYTIVIHGDECFSFTEIPPSTSPSEALNIACKRLKNTLIFINSFLVESYPVAKNIHVMDIIAVIKRGLSADIFNKIENLDDLYMFSLLYSNQIEVLLLLRSLLACIKENILPHSFLITKLLSDCLARSQSYEYFRNKKEFQATVYKVFSYWIFVARSVINLSINDKLINYLLKDIMPAKVTLTLNISPEFAKKTQKRKLNSLEDQLNNSECKSRENTENLRTVKESNCLNALIVLQQLCRFTSLTSKPETRSKLYHSVTNILVEIQQGKIENPYHDVKCQVALYELLLTFFEQKFSKILPPLYLALNIFKNGQTRKNHCISHICSNAIQTLETFCQPICPTLCIGKNLTDDKTNTDEKNHEFFDDTERTQCKLFKDEDSSKKINIISVEVIKKADSYEEDVEKPKPESDENKDCVMESVIDITSSKENSFNDGSPSTNCDSEIFLQIDEESDDLFADLSPNKKLKSDMNDQNEISLEDTLNESKLIDDKEDEMLSSFVDDIVNI